MAAITRILAFAPLALLTLGGCSTNTDRWVGTWEGERHGLVPLEHQDDIAKQIKKIQIKILPTGRFDIVEMGVGGRGEVHFKGDTVYLKLMAELDRPASGDMRLEWQPDGSVLYYDGHAPQPEELKKVAGPEN